MKACHHPGDLAVVVPVVVPDVVVAAVVVAAVHELAPLECQTRDEP